ncbi:MAG: helix-turn-helix domain-containing protein, partial [Eubacterium sp.]|nr:helix-turn-helix domain-containing protein [Eubacterium sp.]
MESYNVKEVAKMLNTSEETVRRWIRAGKLQATMKSRKEGRIITEAMLKEFVKATPKYAAALAT